MVSDHQRVYRVNRHTPLRPANIVAAKQVFRLQPQTNHFCFIVKAEGVSYGSEPLGKVSFSHQIANIFHRKV